MVIPEEEEEEVEGATAGAVTVGVWAAGEVVRGVVAATTLVSSSSRARAPEEPTVAFRMREAAVVAVEEVRQCVRR